MAFYIEKGVPATIRHAWDNSCLLHSIASIVSYKEPDNVLKKAKLLLGIIPDMVNTSDNYKRTPIDIAQKSLAESKSTHAQVFEKLIKLFRKHGGKNGTRT